VANIRWTKTAGRALAVLAVAGVALVSAPSTAGAQTDACSAILLTGGEEVNLTGYTYCLTAGTAVKPNPAADCPTAEERVDAYADPYEVVVGSSTTVYGWGFEPDSASSVYLCSTPVLLGTVTADAAGNVAAAVTVPLGTALGAHTIAVVGRSAGGATRVSYAAINVVAPGSGGGTTTGNLPTTGSDPGRYLAAGSALVLLGAAAVAGARRQTKRGTAV